MSSKVEEEEEFAICVECGNSIEKCVFVCVLIVVNVINVNVHCLMQPPEVRRNELSYY